MPQNQKTERFETILRRMKNRERVSKEDRDFVRSELNRRRRELLGVKSNPHSKTPPKEEVVV